MRDPSASAQPLHVTASPHSMPRAIALMVASTLTFGLMAICIRLAAATTHPFEITFFRNLFGLVFALPLLLRPGLALLRTDRFGFYVLRSMTGLGAMLTSVWALVHLPLTQAVAISYSVPLFVTIAAVLVLGEVVRARRWTAVVVGFVGVLVILRPQAGALPPAALVALLSAALSASSYISVKYLTRTEPADAVVVYMALLMTPVSLVPAVPVWNWPDATAWLWLVLTGLCGTVAQVCMTRAYRLGDVSALIPLNFVQLPFVAVLAWWLFGEHIDATTVFGAAIIVGANIYIARREARLGRRRVTDPRAGGDAAR